MSGTHAHRQQIAVPTVGSVVRFVDRKQRWRSGRVVSLTTTQAVVLVAGRRMRVEPEKLRVWTGGVR